jgi:hypothetical protein
MSFVGSCEESQGNFELLRRGLFFVNSTADEVAIFSQIL